jgi:type IV pilus assembly protein PilV
MTIGTGCPAGYRDLADREAVTRNTGPARGTRGRYERPHLQSRGFTLIEVMIAILLIGVGLLGLAVMSTTVTRGNLHSSSLTAASTIAQERIEQFRTEAYENIASGNDTRVVDGVTYTRTWQVSDNDPQVGLKTITVSVGWTSRGKAHRTSLSTIRGAR